MNKFQTVIFWVILIIALLTRIIFIDKYPPSLNWDEISHGYNAYSILKTGKDEWGNVLPLIFRAYGDYKLPFYIYLTTIPVAILGLNPFSIRLISIIAGSLVPLFVYLIAKNLYPKNKNLPFFAFALAALSPWSIFLSRIAIEANLFLLLFLISLYFLLKSNFSTSAFFYGLCLFTYNSSRVLLPFYLFLLFVLFKKSKTKISQQLPGLIFLFICTVLFLYQSFSSSGQARYKWVSILDEGAISQIEQLRQKYPRFLVNKATFFFFQTSKNYLSHFNPFFLFKTGGSNYQFNIPDFYLIQPIFFAFYLIGIYFLIKEKKYFLLYWFLVSPIPSAVTRDAPHVLRSIIFFPIITIIIANGVIKSKIPFFIFFAAIFVGFVSFWLKYTKYSTEYSSSWQYGYRQAVSITKTNYSKYDQIIFTKKYGEPHEFVLFYWPWDPLSYQSDSNKIWGYHTNWYWVDAFDKFKFINDWEIVSQTQNLTVNTLLVTSPNNYPKNSKFVNSINFLNGEPAFDIVSLNHEN